MNSRDDSNASSKASRETADYWIQGLNLAPHPEGGYYRESYRSNVQIDVLNPAEEFSGSRSISTAIYYLLNGSEFSAFHRIRSDEMWHHYAGAGLTINMIDSAGEYGSCRLGSRLEGGASPQRVVPARTWFAAKPEDPTGYSLVGCTVTPGFDFQDFELARRDELVRQFPAHRSVIDAFTRA